MTKLIPLVLLAVALSGCAHYSPPYYASVQYGPWSNYNPYYEYGGYRSSGEPIAYYGPADAPYGRTYYAPAYGPGPY